MIVHLVAYYKKRHFGDRFHFFLAHVCMKSTDVWQYWTMAVIKANRNRPKTPKTNPYRAYMAFRPKKRTRLLEPDFEADCVGFLQGNKILEA